MINSEQLKKVEEKLTVEATQSWSARGKLVSLNDLKEKSKKLTKKIIRSIIYTGAYATIVYLASRGPIQRGCTTTEIIAISMAALGVLCPGMIGYERIKAKKETDEDLNKLMDSVAVVVDDTPEERVL